VITAEAGNRWAIVEFTHDYESYGLSRHIMAIITATNPQEIIQKGIAHIPTSR
jgi:hypothetical protein